MKLPSLIPAIEADLARGECVVVQLVSTAEAMLDRALAGLGAEGRANLDIELSPREYLMDYLTAAFPVRQMRTYVDDSGKIRSEPMRSEEHTSELQSLMRISYAVVCLKKKKN